jgi:DNA-binding NarL/FixJ family response regulator
MSEGTIRNNISTILDKLDIRDRTQLAIFFIRNLEK